MSEPTHGPLKALTRVVTEKQRQLAAQARFVLSQRGYRASRADLEDVLADAWLAAGRRLRKDDVQINNMEAWFRRVLFFSCLSFLRKQLPGADGRDVEDLLEEGEILEALHYEPNTSERIYLEELTAKLSDEDRSLVSLAAQGYTSKEIAEIQGNLTQDAVRQRISRALRGIRNSLGAVD